MLYWDHLSPVLSFYGHDYKLGVSVGDGAMQGSPLSLVTTLQSLSMTPLRGGCLYKKAHVLLLALTAIMHPTLMSPRGVRVALRVRLDCCHHKGHGRSPSAQTLPSNHAFQALLPSLRLQHCSLFHPRPQLEYFHNPAHISQHPDDAAT